MTRDERINELRQDEPFDLLVIGGGATGCGVALDAASRGLKTALIEKHDFGEGTSSRSTKLVHGGVRYLEMAIRRFDRTQYNLVRDGLYERGVLLMNAPHLAGRLPLVTPLYTWLEVPYLFAGLKLYDLLAGKKGIGHSRLISRKEALERFPMIRSSGLKAGVLYYDGQFNDARMAISLVLTAKEHGAVTVNHVEAISLLKDRGEITGALVCDRISGEEFAVRARGVINAAGPFADAIRRMDDPGTAPILNASSGIHIVLDKRFAPPATGLMIPRTEDGRVLFILPWQGHALIGTTDEPADIVDHPFPTGKEISYLLRHVGRYFDLDITEKDIKSAWSGLRPLLHDPKAADTAHIARDYIVQVSASGLLTVAGGKWTTYRRMAQDVVDHAIKAFILSPARGCRTERLSLIGAVGHREEGDRILARDYNLCPDIAHHLHRFYGSKARDVALIAQTGLGERLHPDHPIIEAEVAYAARYEQAERAADVLVRRTTLALLDKKAASAVAKRTIEIMAGELGWDEMRCRTEAEIFDERLRTAI
jgi:glycerol-3-phosphate dehydrogenase